jgi:hypothetical protein
MLAAVGVAAKPYPPAFRLALEHAVESLKAFSKLRNQLSEGGRVDTARQRFVDQLTDALKELPRQQQ